MKFFDELRNLDRNNIGGWSKSVKMFFTALVFLVVMILGWYLHVSDQQDSLEQLAQMELMLQQMLRQLPSKNEMPDLIVDVSQTALATGISNELFQPGPETAKEFYAEKPISLRMVGTYHQFGAFVSGVASLPRVVIMTMHNISLTPRAGKPGLLVLEGTIRTYRYLDEEEIAAQGGAPAAGGSK